MIFVGVFDLSLVFFESRDETGDERLNSLSETQTQAKGKIQLNKLISLGIHVRNYNKYLITLSC